MDPRTKIVQETAREWREAGRLPVGDDATGRTDDRAYWVEVVARIEAAGYPLYGPLDGASKDM